MHLNSPRQCLTRHPTWLGTSSRGASHGSLQRRQEHHSISKTHFCPRLRTDTCPPPWSCRPHRPRVSRTCSRACWCRHRVWTTRLYENRHALSLCMACRAVDPPHRPIMRPWRQPTGGRRPFNSTHLTNAILTKLSLDAYRSRRNHPPCPAPAMSDRLRTRTYTLIPRHPSYTAVKAARVHGHCLCPRPSARLLQLRLKCRPGAKTYTRSGQITYPRTGRRSQITVVTARCSD